MPFQTYDFPLIKATATGNDFLIADLMDSTALALWNETFGKRARAEWAKTWCERNNGLGADGLVILEKDNSLDFKWDFYNSDGSSAEMCGNAARAVSLYVSRKTGKAELNFTTAIGPVHANVRSNEQIEILLPKIKAEEWGRDFDFVVAGVPHAVVKIDKLDDTLGLTERALAIKRMDRFKKDGTNVTFVRTLGPDHIQTKTYERGVEGFTRSCGTGAVAAAHSVLRGAENRSLRVDVPGGRLSVIWKNEKPILSGPALIVGEMRWMK